MIWHSSDITEIKNELATDFENGLSSSEIAERILKFGQNRLAPKGKRKIYKRLIRRFTLPLNLALIIMSIVVMVISIAQENSLWYTSFVVLLLLAANTAIDVFVNHKSEKEMQDLRGSITLWAKVIRDGTLMVVDDAQLVPGDIVVLKEGDYIPADGRLIESHSLICEESTVSGDSAPSEKQFDYIPEDMSPVGERKNMVFSGCSVLYGNGKMVVTETGMNTEKGRQTSLFEQTVGSDIAIKRRLQRFAKNSRPYVLITSLLIFLFAVIFSPAENGFGVLVMNMLLVAFATAVTAAPEFLSSVVNLTVGFGARRILKNKTTVKNIQAIEDLGCTSVIISDKTGTLTKNRMKMTMLFDGSELIDLNLSAPSENGVTVIRTGALCGNGRIILNSVGKERSVGDPTEVGIVLACMEYCNMTKDDIENIYPRMGDVPFDSTRQLMTTINMINNRPFAIVKGSPDILTLKCTAGNIDGATKAAEEMAKRGLRAIAVAIKPLDSVPANPTPDNMECDLTLLGIFGMTDKISSETTAAIRSSEIAGIRTVMITGDHITAAEAIAKDMGILKEGELSITGEDLEKMSDDDLVEKIRDISVYSRISVEDKLRIIDAWHKVGETVAMTGDSVADAAVLKAADIGCAMGVTGTDIAKGSADVVLDEDSYISIVGAVKESRGIYANIKHITSQIISVNFGILAMIFLGTFIFGGPILSPLAIIFLGLIMNFIPVIALASESAGKCVLTSSPRIKKDSFFREEFGISLIWQSLMIAIIGIIAFAIGGAAAAFGAIAISQVSLAIGLRSDISIIKEGIHTNLYMVIALALAVLITIIIVSTPLGEMFYFEELSTGGAWSIALLPILPFAVTEGVKFGKEIYSKKQNKE